MINGSFCLAEFFSEIDLLNSLENQFVEKEEIFVNFFDETFLEAVKEHLIASIFLIFLGNFGYSRSILS
jgi:hypothetical protein